MNIVEKGNTRVTIGELPPKACFVCDNELYVIMSCLNNLEKYDYAYEVACFNLDKGKVELFDSGIEVIRVEVDVTFKRV